MNKTLITGTGLTKAYGENTVLHGIDVDIHAGDFTVIMGASGSGKSTLLHTLSGMDRLSGGQLFYQGRDITNASEKELTKLRRSEFGFVFQRTHLIGNLTLFENIQMYSRSTPPFPWTRSSGSSTGIPLSGRPTSWPCRV